MKIKHLISVAIGLLLISTAVFAQTYQTYVPFEVYGLNTVAGSSTILKTSKITPGTKVIFNVKKPDGQTVNIPVQTNNVGVATVDFSDYHTKLAGTYFISVNKEGATESPRVNSFIVYPGQVSGSLSEIYPKDQVIRLASESAKLTVKLLDAFKNPISGHKVKLISGSATDQIKLSKNSDVSDNNGEVFFQINSKNSGVVSYSVYDVTSDVILDSKAKVVYFNSNNEIFQNTPVVKSASYTPAYGNSAGPVDGFEFEDVPGDITANQSVTLKITAYDNNKQSVLNYTGKVRFSIDGANSTFANVPDDYTFTLQDQGSHTFSLAFLFKQAGSYNLKVTDLDNFAVFGTKTITVNAGGSGNANIQSGIVISNPVAGTYSSNVQVVSGTAPAGAKLKIFDNDKEIASVIADASGKYSFTTGLLIDGSHKIYVASVNDIGTIVATSSTVDVNIDTQAASVSQVTIEPEGAVDPGTVIKVKLYAEENLSKAQVVVSGNVYNLAKNVQGYYETSFSAPIEFGEYKLNFVLVDDLGNESKFTAEKVIKVGTLDFTAKSKPGKVTGLIATPADTRVTLNWIAPVASLNPIKNYRVYYGSSPNQLTNAVDTFTAATTWYIPNLANGAEYYFAVAAVDTKGNVSEGFEKIVSSIPTSSVVYAQPPEITNGVQGGEALNDMKKDVSESGPEMLWLLLLSAIGGILYSIQAKKRARL